MGESFHFEDADGFDAVATGEPGQRVFFLHVTHGQQSVHLKLEKQQVAALAAHLARMLVDLPQSDAAASNTTDGEPEGSWIVGALGAAYDQHTDRVLVVAEELVETDEDDEPILDDEGQGMLTVRLTRGQAAAFVTAAEVLVEAGRPPCPWCARPLDPTGHLCARMN